MKKLLLIALAVLCSHYLYPWGFYAHRQINYYAVFMLPPEMMALYKPNIQFLSDHAVDPDKRRYAVAAEGARHYIDIDHYGTYPFDSLPHSWPKALEKYGNDTLQAYGIVPWYIQTMMFRLTAAFKAKDQVKVLKLSADIGHYIADAHVPLHVCSNHNGQLTNQQGIHAFWESRIPELLAATSWSFLMGKATYIEHPGAFIWSRVLESAGAADSVLRIERELTARFSPDQKYSFEPRNGLLIKQYATAYCLAYDQQLNNMIERRMQQSIMAVASCWYTAWVNAGQPDLKTLTNQQFSEDDRREFEELNAAWLKGTIKGKDCD
ncbi:S1/P1 Nuclease [Niastella vici]|uniref:S1/P1 Nuclease n=1 Tax=Niastella vici TaxID=1703345 RepID=A0A1V9G633_9BACT|nr:zinc dependent phospholipase C family protein [Niastella vici]OQP66091.1 S1/P1 Nuclease [Niastella vici]